MRFYLSGRQNIIKLSIRTVENMKCLADMSNNMTVLSSLYRDAYEFTLIKRYNLLKANIKSASNFAVNNFPAEFNYVIIYNMKILLVLF